ncbi:MAG TPA: HAMP domain-containing protein, partial [Bradyrhizobium sp.]
MKTAMAWFHLGLRGRLFMAFGVVAALTVLASSSAIISYDSLGRSLGAITERSLPEITRASKVVRAAGEVAAAAPRLLAATDAAEREHAFKVLTDARQELTQSIGALAAEDAARLNKTADRILVNLDRLTQSVAERQTIAASRDALVASLRKSHQKLAEKLSPMADDAGFTLTMGLQTAAENQDLEVVKKTLAGLADNELVSLQAILELRSESNLILGILVEAADLPSAELLPPVKDRFTSTAGRIAKAASAFKDPETSKLVNDLLKSGKDGGNIFELKQKELVAAKTGANVVTENRALAQEFEQEVASLGTRSQAGAATALHESEAEIRQGRIIRISLALVSLATALVIGWLYVGRGVVRRLVHLQNSMKSIAAGDLATEVATGGSDEIADMAKALQVFKDNMLESNRLRAERSETEKRARAQRKEEMRKLADEFEAAVGEIVQTVSSASTELESSATSLTKTAEETQQLSGMVESASEEASSNV